MNDYTVNIFWNHENLDMFRVVTFIIPNTDKAHLCSHIEYALSRSFAKLYARAALEASCRVKHAHMCVDTILDPESGRLLAYTINHHTGEVNMLSWEVEGACGQWLGLKIDNYY